MNWFLAKLVFRIVCGHGNHLPQFDEQLRLIYAEDELHAFHKARLLGESDCEGDTVGIATGVRWKFIDISELYPLVSFMDGAEIHSQKLEEADAELYIRSIQKRASLLLQRSLHQFTGINRIAIGT